MIESFRYPFVLSYIIGIDIYFSFRALVDELLFWESFLDRN